MNRIVLSLLGAVALLAGCSRSGVSPRSTLPMVLSIAADTTGESRLAATAGKRGPDGSIAIIGEPSEALALVRSFLSADRRDNVDGRARRDSLPDFAGETFDVILDDLNAPYSHFVTSGEAPLENLDSLREAAVQNALFAWDSTCVSAAKQRAKILIYTSSLQAEYGLFDVDTLQQLTGGESLLICPAEVLLQKAYAAGHRNMAVWTSAPVRASGAWQAVFGRMGFADASLEVITPESALDSRTSLRNLLRQYRATGKSLDALVLDCYGGDVEQLHSELRFIGLATTEEDTALSAMLAEDFALLEPVSAVVEACYQLLRERRLFTHRISHPAARYYQSVESGTGLPALIEVAPSYVQHHYVPHYY